MITRGEWICCCRCQAISGRLPRRLHSRALQSSAKAMLLLLMLLATFALDPAVNGEPTTGSRIVGVVPKQFYEMFFEEKSYSGAEDACDDTDGFLAVVRDADVMAQLAAHSVHRWAVTTTRNTSGWERFVWVALEKKEGESGRWRWSDNTRFRGRFLPDEDGEKGNDSRRCGGVLTSPFRAPVFQRRNCDFKAPYICQYDPKPCPPSAALSGSVPGGPFIACDKAAAMQNLLEMANDCRCPAGQVRHTVDQVACNRQQWYWNAYCVDGCPPVAVPTTPHTTPTTAIIPLSDSPPVLWQGSSAYFLCLRGLDTPRLRYNLVTLTCKEGGLWSGYQQGRFCEDVPGKEEEGSAEVVNVVRGSDVVLECRHESQPSSGSSWWLVRGDSAKVSKDGRHRMLLNSGRELRIENVKETDQDAYLCGEVFRNVSVLTKVYFVFVVESSSISRGASLLDVRLWWWCFLLLIIIIGICVL